MKKFSYGIIGAGNMGQTHAATFGAEAGVVLRAVCDLKRESAEALVAKHGGQVVDDWKAMVKDPAIDFIVITSPQSEHAQQAILAAKAGKHIFCEKPLALTLAELDLVKAAVDKAGVRFMVGHQMRFHPVVQAVQATLPRIAPCYSMELEWTFRIKGHEGRCWMNYRQGGFFMELGCHLCDLSRLLFGDVTSLQANTLRIDPNRVTEDYTRLLVQYGNHAIGSLVVSANDRSRRQGLLNGRIRGVKGSIEFSCYPYGRILNRARLITESGRDIFIPDFKTEEIAVENRPSTSKTYPGYFDVYNRQAKAFLAALRDKRKPIPCTLEDGRAAVEMVLTAYCRQEELSRKPNFPPKRLPESGAMAHPLLEGATALV